MNTAFVWPGGIWRVISEPAITIKSVFLAERFANSYARFRSGCGISSECGWYSKCSVVEIQSIPSLTASETRISGQTDPSENTVCMWKSQLIVLAFGRSGKYTFCSTA